MLREDLARVATQVVVLAPLVGHACAGWEGAGEDLSVLKRVGGTIIERHPIARLRAGMVVKRGIDDVCQDVHRCLRTVQQISRAHVIVVVVIDGLPRIDEAVCGLGGCRALDCGRVLECWNRDKGRSDRGSFGIVVCNRDLLTPSSRQGRAFIRELDDPARRVRD